jgi:hypothetical protein
MNHLSHIPLYLFYVTLFVFIITKVRFFEIENLDKNYLIFFFGLKALAGILLTLIYTYYYTDQTKADIYRYFNDSKVISAVLFHNPVAWAKIMTGIGAYDTDAFAYLVHTQYFSHPTADFVTSNAFLIRFISLLNYFSCADIFIDTLFFNFITFTGFVFLLKAFQPFFRNSEKLLCIPVFLIPSIVFWSSGLLKEPLMIAGVSCYLYLWLTADSRNMLITVMVLAMALLFVSLLKLYVAAMLILCSIFLPFGKSFTGLPFPLARRAMLFLVILSGFWYFFSQQFCEKIIYKRNEFVLLSIAENAGSSLDKQLAEPDCEHLFALVPPGLVNTMFRPFAWEGGKLFQRFFGIETLLQFLFIVALIPFWKIPPKTKLSLSLFCFSFAFLNYLMIGITIPVLGAIVHYRITGILFLLLGVLMITDLEKLKGKFGRNKSG